MGNVWIYMCQIWVSLASNLYPEMLYKDDNINNNDIDTFQLLYLAFGQNQLKGKMLNFLRIEICRQFEMCNQVVLLHLAI